MTCITTIWTYALARQRGYQGTAEEYAALPLDQKFVLPMIWERDHPGASRDEIKGFRSIRKKRAASRTE